MFYHKCTYVGLHVRYPIFFSDFHEIFMKFFHEIFSKILKTPQILNFLKFFPVEADLFHADGLTGASYYNKTAHCLHFTATSATNTCNAALVLLIF